ncbi:MAG: type I restriction enzyme HsdR N-terminal domain-containing protein [bacterium]
MPTRTQKSKLHKLLKQYRRQYLIKRYESLDESATRLMINSFLTEVLGYTELDEIKTEYTIKGTYADYVIQINRKKHFIVEVKAIDLDLSEKHLMQSVNYAANEGIDWVLLTNGRRFELYKVLFTKPINAKRIFSFDLSDEEQLKAAVDFLIYLTKRSVLRKELNHFWKRFEALDPASLHRYLYTQEVIRYLRRTLRRKTGVLFSEDDILDSLHKIVTTRVSSTQPKEPITCRRKRKESSRSDITLKTQRPDLDAPKTQLSP